MGVATAGVQVYDHTTTRSLSRSFLLPGRGKASGYPDALANGGTLPSCSSITTVRASVGTGAGALPFARYSTAVRALAASPRITNVTTSCVGDVAGAGAPGGTSHTMTRAF